MQFMIMHKSTSTTFSDTFSLPTFKWPTTKLIPGQWYSAFDRSRQILPFKCHKIQWVKLKFTKDIMVGKNEMRKCWGTYISSDNCKLMVKWKLIVGIMNATSTNQLIPVLNIWILTMVKKSFLYVESTSFSLKKHSKIHTLFMFPFLHPLQLIIYSVKSEKISWNFMTYVNHLIMLQMKQTGHSVTVLSTYFVWNWFWKQ